MKLLHLILHRDPSGPPRGEDQDLEDQGIKDHPEVKVLPEGHFLVTGPVPTNPTERTKDHQAHDCDIKTFLYIMTVLDTVKKTQSGLLRLPSQQEEICLILFIIGPML